MSEQLPESWGASVSLARAILNDRKERRKWLARLTMVPLGMIASGVWWLDDWIWGSPWRVLCWWGGTAVVTVTVMGFALYDALKVLREEKLP